MDDLSGQVIKGYKLCKLVDTGGFGAVYCAYQPLLGCEVSIKVILPQHANQPDFIRRYERGSILLTSNRAPNEWPELFGDPLLASAGLDRLLHHAEVLVITGSSFRAQGRQQLEQEVFIAQPVAS